MKLIDVAAIVESSNNQYAIRFEPVSFQDKPLWIVGTLKLIMAYNKGIDYDTALCIGCTSYGLYQILGANIYADGYDSNIFTYASDPLAQQDNYIHFIAGKGFNPDEDISTWNDERFNAYATFYNGPGNVAGYVAAMKKANMGNG